MNKSESKYFNTAIRMDKAFLELLETKDFAYITVKEICERAGVNRSTFYLHYETIADLLNESIEYINREFESYFFGESKPDARTADIDELFLITPRYLLPYLRFIKDNRRVFKIAMEKTELLGSKKNFKLLFDHVFAPIMSRYRIADQKKPWLLSFYIGGIMAIVKMWLEGDCREPIEFISKMITECVRTPIQ